MPCPICSNLTMAHNAVPKMLGQAPGSEPMLERADEIDGFYLFGFVVGCNFAARDRWTKDNAVTRMREVAARCCDRHRARLLAGLPGSK